MAYTNKLRKEELIVQQTLNTKYDSPTLDNSPFLYGTILEVSQLQDFYAIGDVVIFDASNSTQFTLASDTVPTLYSLITTDAIHYIQS
jgi:hypothetical protein